MRIELNQVIFGISGAKAIPNAETGKDFTLKDACMHALLHPGRDDTGKQKDEAYKFFLKLRECETDEIELTIEEVAELKEKIGVFYAPLISGQARQQLEGQRGDSYGSLKFNQ